MIPWWAGAVLLVAGVLLGVCGMAALVSIGSPDPEDEL